MSNIEMNVNSARQNALAYILRWSFSGIVSGQDWKNEVANMNVSVPKNALESDVYTISVAFMKATIKSQNTITKYGKVYKVTCSPIDRSAELKIATFTALEKGSRTSESKVLVDIECNTKTGYISPFQMRGWRVMENSETLSRYISENPTTFTYGEVEIAYDAYERVINTINSLVGNHDANSVMIMFDRWLDTIPGVMNDGMRASRMIMSDYAENVFAFRETLRKVMPDSRLSITPLYADNNDSAEDVVYAVKQTMTEKLEALQEEVKDLLSKDKIQQRSAKSRVDAFLEIRETAIRYKDLLETETALQQEQLAQLDRIAEGANKLADKFMEDSAGLVREPTVTSTKSSERKAKNTEAKNAAIKRLEEIYEMVSNDSSLFMTHMREYVECANKAYDSKESSEVMNRYLYLYK